MSTSSIPRLGARTASLARLAAIGAELGSEHVARDAQEMAHRVAEGRFFLATIGQFKRGKSTLLNALLGDTLLPTGVAPVTSAITIVRYGSELSADVAFKDGRRARIGVSDVHTFVTEEDNPENRRGVSAVEIFSPAPLLATGMCLVDTPGLGSVFQGNTEETRAFVPHIDAALVVLGADPPIGGDELALVSEVAQRVEQLVFVLNKADRVSAGDMVEVRRFTTDVLARQLNRPVERLFDVSATERVAHGPTRDWNALESRLRELTSNSEAVVDRSARRGIERISARLLRDLREQQEALTRPLEQSERRIGDLRRSIRQAERLLLDLAALFRDEEQRIISGFFDTMHQTFISSSTPSLRDDLAQAVLELGSTHRGGALREAAYHTAREIVTRRIGQWLAEIEPRAELSYRWAAERFIKLANEYLDSLRSSGDSSFEHLPGILDPDAGFRTPRHFVFTDLMHLTSVGPLDWTLDRIRSHSAAVRAISNDAIGYAQRLLVSNSSRVIFDLRERLSESRQSMESELRSMLTEVYTSARRALTHARELRKSGQLAVARELQQLNQHRDTLNELVAEAAAHDDQQR
jgi:hypothetical protein